MRIKALAILTCLLFLGCATAPIADYHPEPHKITGVIESKFSDVWKKAVTILSIDLNMPLKVTDITSGIIQTDWKEVEAPPQSFIEAFQTTGTGYLGGRYRYNFIVSMQPTQDDKSEVTIVSYQQILSGTGSLFGFSTPQWVDRKSDGSKEQDILKRLGGK